MSIEHPRTMQHDSKHAGADHVLSSLRWCTEWCQSLFGPAVSVEDVLAFLLAILPKATRSFKVVVFCVFLAL